MIRMVVVVVVVVVGGGGGGGGGAEAVNCLVMAAQLPWWGGCGGRGEGSLEDVQGSRRLRNITYLL